MYPDRTSLLRAARRLLVSTADAEDAVQDTYVRALTAFPGAQKPEPAWLYTVLRHVAIDRLRHDRLEAQCTFPESSAPSADRMWEIRSECEAAIRHLLRRVSPAEAAAMLLRDVFEFGYDELGHLLSKSEATLRQWLHRARNRSRRSGPSADLDELHVVLCWRAIEAREPALLMQLLQVTTAGAQQIPRVNRPAHRGPRAGARSTSVLVQVDGRYAVALVLDGVVLCVVPVGAPELTGESA